MPRVSQPRIILASRSPRRASLLREAGLVFEQITPPYNDPPHPGAGSARDVAAEVALRKMQSIPLNPNEQSIVITADTLIAFPDGTLAGTPRDVDEARAMIRRFISAWHDVITGIALRGPGETQAQVLTEASSVYLGEVGESALEQYLASGAWRDKAGGYNLFDREAAGWPLTVRGDRTNVVGLPMQRLLSKLKAWGVHASPVEKNS